MSATPPAEPLLDALASLRDGAVDDAAAHLEAARVSAAAVAEIDPERAQLIAMVAERIEAARRQQARAPAEERPPAKVVEAATREGDAALSRAVGALGRRVFDESYEQLDLARAAYERAGSEVMRSRAMSLENIYANIRVEVERDERIKALIARKKIVEDARLKRKASALSLDEEQIELLLAGEEDE